MLPCPVHCSVWSTITDVLGGAQAGLHVPPPSPSTAAGGLSSGCRRAGADGRRPPLQQQHQGEQAKDPERDAARARLRGGVVTALAALQMHVALLDDMEREQYGAVLGDGAVLAAAAVLRLMGLTSAYR